MPAPRTDYARDTATERELRAAQQKIVRGEKAVGDRRRLILRLWDAGYPQKAIADVINREQDGEPITAGAVQKIIARAR